MCLSQGTHLKESEKAKALTWGQARQDGNRSSKPPDFLCIQTPERGTWDNSADSRGSPHPHPRAPRACLFHSCARRGKRQRRGLLSCPPPPAPVPPQNACLSYHKAAWGGSAKVPLSQAATCGVPGAPVSSNPKAGTGIPAAWGSRPPSEPPKESTNL